jgi:CBS domain containing-hemolysin-like protein
VIGDICRILSGSATAYIVIKIVQNRTSLTLVEMILTGLVASLTVGGKSIGKSVAIKNSNKIIYRVAVLIRIFKRR